MWVRLHKSPREATTTKRPQSSDVMMLMTMIKDRARTRSGFVFGANRDRASFLKAETNFLSVNSRDLGRGFSLAETLCGLFWGPVICFLWEKWENVD